MKKFKIIIIGLMIFISVALIPEKSYAEELSEEDYEKLAEVIKQELKNGDLDSKEDIKEAIENAEEEFDLEISESEKNKVVSVMDTVNKLGLDPEKVADMVDDVYDKVIQGKDYENTDDMINAIEDEIIESATDKVEEKIKDKLNNSIGDYFKVFVERIKKQIERIKNLWTK